MRIWLSLAATLLVTGAAWAQDSQKSSTAPQGNTGSSATSTTQGSNTAPAELKTQTYKGTLMDASCAGGATTTTQANPPAGSTEKNTANRTSGEPASSCSVSANTKEFALRTKDGQTYRFDSVGNTRAEEALKNKKKWNNDVSAGKPIHASVSAHLEGDRLTVVSIH